MADGSRAVPRADSRDHVKTFDGRTDAKTWLENTTVSVATGSYVAPQRAKMTVGAAGTSWLAGRVDLKPKTAAGYADLWSRRIAPTGSACPRRGERCGRCRMGRCDARRRTKPFARVRQAADRLVVMLADAVTDRRLAVESGRGSEAAAYAARRGPLFDARATRRPRRCLRRLPDPHPDVGVLRDSMG